MDKSLKAIQVLSKIGFIISKIVKIVCIVAAAICLVGMICVSIGVPEVFHWGNITIHGLVENVDFLGVGSLYSNMANGLIVCLGEVFLARFAEKYFKNELAAGTPFTLEGAKEMLRLGILSICIPIGSQIVSAIVRGLIWLRYGEWGEFDFGNSVSVGLGITFIIVSVIFRYGASLENKKSNL